MTKADFEVIKESLDKGELEQSAQRNFAPLEPYLKEDTNLDEIIRQWIDETVESIVSAVTDMINDGYTERTKLIPPDSSGWNIGIRDSFSEFYVKYLIPRIDQAKLPTEETSTTPTHWNEVSLGGSEPVPYGTITIPGQGTGFHLVKGRPITLSEPDYTLVRDILYAESTVVIQAVLDLIES